MGGGIFCLSAAAVLVLSISGLYRKGWGSYDTFQAVVIPLFAVVIFYSMYIQESSPVLKFAKSRLLQHFNKIAYEFYLAQFFCFKLAMRVVEQISVLDNSFGKTAIAFVIDIGMAVFAHEIITKPCKKVICGGKGKNGSTLFKFKRDNRPIQQ